MTTPSWMFTLLPMRMLLTSPLTTALNQTLHLSPIFTSPTTVALGAIKQLFPNCGDFPSTGSMTAMLEFFLFVVEFRQKIAKKIILLCSSMNTENQHLFLRHV